MLRERVVERHGDHRPLYRLVPEAEALFDELAPPMPAPPTLQAGEPSR